MNQPNILDCDSKVPVILSGNITMKNGKGSAALAHQNGIVKFTLHDVPAYAAGFVIKSETSVLAGLVTGETMESSFTSNAIKVKFPYKTGYNYSTDNDGDDDPDDAVIFVPLPAGSYSDLQVYLIDGDGDIIEGTEKQMKPATVRAGDYVVMPVLDLKKSELRKDFVKVIGVKWAKGNLVFDQTGTWNQETDSGFQTSWGLHDEQWKFVNWDGSMSATTGSYSNDKTQFDHFNYGGIGRRSRFGSVYMLPSVPKYSIAGKIYKGTDPSGSDPVKLTEASEAEKFTAPTNMAGADVKVTDGSELFGDIAFWASKGKYRLPTAGNLSELSHKTSSKASFQFGHYKPEGSDVTIYGVLYTTPQGDAVTRNYNDVEFTDADIESGLFLPKAGRRGPRSGHSTTVNSGGVMEQGTIGVYRCATFGSLEDEYPYSKENTTVLELGNEEVGYGYTFWSSGGTPGNKYLIYSSSEKTDVIDHKYSVRAGLSIRPVLVDGTVTDGDVTPLPSNPFNVKVGEPLPAWSEGCLDIHAINSGRGECTFFILPDGTTLCVDAGEIAPTGGTHPRVDAKPNADTRAYKVYSEYIKTYLPQGDTSMDYMLMTHFHNDHFGTTNALDDYPLVTRDSYKYPSTGIMALYDEVPFDKVIDRAYDASDPQYTSVPETGEECSPGYGYYGQFVAWASQTNGMKVEKAVNGSTTQLALVNSPSAYPDFKIQINAVDCWYWNGSESVDSYALKRLFGKVPGENGNSISFLLSYGGFDYLTSGDAGTNTDVALPLAESINRKIEAMKAHHHFAWNAMSAEMMAIYQPKVVVSQSFYDHQPDMGHSWTCNGVDYSGTSSSEYQSAWSAYTADDKYWYFTNIHETTASTYPSEVAKMSGRDGHVVIRVAEGGGYFYVYLLDDTDFSYKVKSVTGPIYCH